MFCYTQNDQVGYTLQLKMENKMLELECFDNMERMRFWRVDKTLEAAKWNLQQANKERSP